MAQLVTLDAIREAAGVIRGTARVTPLIDVSHPPEPPLLLKCENLQLGGAFKIRGALNVIGHLDGDAARQGVIAYSSGNHGRAVAMASRLAGIPAVIVMPVTASPFKVAAVRALGAELIMEGTTSTDRQRRAEAEAAARGLTLVPPFDHERIIAGQGTVGLELLEQRTDLDEVYVPVGGGGLISGVAAAIKSLRPTVRVTGVEPRGAAKMTASLRVGRPITLERTTSVADGLRPVRPGDLTFAHVRAHVDEVVTVDEEEIVAAVDWLFHEAKLVVEPSGAAAFAALARARRSGHVTATAAAVLSGGNIAAGDLAALVSGERR